MSFDMPLRHLRRELTRCSRLRTTATGRLFAFGMKMLQLFTFADQSRAVEDHNQRTRIVQNGGHDRTDDAKRSQTQSTDDEENTKHEILVDDSPGAARELH